MPLDELTGEVVTLRRNEERDKWLRSYHLRNPDADIDPGSEPYILAVTYADQKMVVYNDATNIGAACTSRNKTGSAVDEALEELGMERLPATGASGYVEIGTSAGGTYIFRGDELIDPNTSTRYMCNESRTYDDGEDVPIVGVDTGPGTDRDPGTVLQWAAPRPGCGTYATVIQQNDAGDGLTGGRYEETDKEALARIKDWKSNQPASGNDAAYRKAMKEVPGLRVEQGFTYPACLGPGTMAVAFTLPPVLGGSRCPNAVQLSQMYEYLVGQFPADDSLFVMAMIEQTRDVCLDVDWTTGVAQWSNTAPWPAYYELSPGSGSGGLVVDSSPTPSATTFGIKTYNADYTTCGAPTVGTVVAVYDTAKGVFRRKEISQITGTGPWTVICETANAASDLTYTPVAGQRICPWSDSLNALAAKVREYFDGLGPGEQQTTFTDEGLRQKRQPEAPANWHHAVTSARMLRVLLDLDALNDCDVIEGEGATTTGTPGTLVYLLTLRYLAAFPS
jgi:hypothetical protein